MNLHTPTVFLMWQPHTSTQAHTHTQTNPRTYKETEAKNGIHYKRGHNKKCSHRDSHTHMTSQMQQTMTTHTDAHVESQGLCKMTSPLNQPAAEDGLCWTKQVVAGALNALVCVCVCVCRWCNECWRCVGAALSSAVCCWHTNTEIPSDTG